MTKSPPLLGTYERVIRQLALARRFLDEPAAVLNSAPNLLRVVIALLGQDRALGAAVGCGQRALPAGDPEYPPLAPA